MPFKTSQYLAQVMGFHAGPPCNNVQVGLAPVPSLPDHPLIRAPLAIITDWGTQQALESPRSWTRLYEGYGPYDKQGRPTNFSPVDVPEACLSIPSRLSSGLTPPSDAQPSIAAPYPIPLTDPSASMLAWGASQGVNMHELWDKGPPLRQVWVPGECLRIKPRIDF